MIRKLVIENFKLFKGRFELELKEGVNILVGDNESGKSTVLEAIHLALTGIFRGKPIQWNLTQYLFNYSVLQEYFTKVNNNESAEPPKILIELYFDDTFPELEGNKYSDTTQKGRVYGIGLEISLNEKFSDEYHSVISEGNVESLPIEYYDVDWFTFARKALTSRSVPTKSSLIDVGFSKFSNGSDMYISRIIHNLLELDDKTKVAQAFRRVKESFSKDASIKHINKKITDISKLSDKNVELSVDLSSRSTWDGSLITEFDKIPFDFIGKGEQAIIKTDLALSNRRSEASDIILVEEPESHISHSRLNQLLNSIKDHYRDKQIILSTHSSFVSNKLGLDNLILLNKQSAVRFADLESKVFFEKISGYDTLRFILSKKAILVEGPSDELVIQRAYMDLHNGKLPIEDGVEVISVGTSFLRFLEIANYLNFDIKVVADNDGDIAALNKKYKNYLGINQKPNIEICFDDRDLAQIMASNKTNLVFNYNTLEPSLIEANNLITMNEILGKDYKTVDELIKFMLNNKTDCALKIFTSKKCINYPEYILRAIR